LPVEYGDGVWFRSRNEFERDVSLTEDDCGHQGHELIAAWIALRFRSLLR
jgi:hypothetical protein